MVLLLGFGNTADGQLGMGGCELEQIVDPSPMNLPFPSNVSLLDIACSSNHCLLGNSEGEVASSGNNDNLQLGRDGPTKKFGMVTHLHGIFIKQVACGARHSLALTKSGHVMSWGNNEFGQLGLGKTKDEEISMPIEINITEVVQIHCGANHCLALKKDGDLLTWGQNGNGQLGLGHKENIFQPTHLNSLQGIPLSQLCAGSYHSVVLSTSGALFTWGLNYNGQLGIGDTLDHVYPVFVKSLRHQKMAYVSCGHLHSAALTYDGRLFTFGSDSYGQLGHGVRNGDSASSQLLPRQVMELMGTPVARLACGRCHTIAVTKGKVYAFGLGSNGQLGLGHKQNTNLPTSLKLQQEVNAVFSGGDYSIIIQEKFDADKVPGAYFELGEIEYLTLKKTEALLQKYLSEGDEEIFSVFENVFASSASICNSFLMPAPMQYSCNKFNMGVDLDSVLEANELLAKSAISKDIDNLILKCVEWSIVGDLPASPPHVECVRLYVLLPFFNVFADPKNCFKLHSPFAEKFAQLSKLIRVEVIGEWISKVEKRHMRRLICNFKCVISHLLLLPWDNPPAQVEEREKCLKYCLEYMSMLNDVNIVSKKVNYDMFYVTELAEKIDMRQTYVRWLMRKGKDVFSFCDYSFIFDASVKTMLLQTDAAVQMQLQVEEANRWNIQSLFLPMQYNVDPFLSLTISRDNIVHDTIQQLMGVSSLDLKKPIRVQFAGEEADDAGGVKKEFFLLLFRQLLLPDYGMFVEFAESRRLWLSTNPFEEASMYQLVGVLFGLAIYNSVLVEVNFPLAFYKKLLKKDILLEDFMQLSPTEGRSLEQLLDYEGDDFEEIFCLTFELQELHYGETRTVELKPMGSKIPVTKDSRAEYVQLYVDHKLNSSIRDQFDAFADGFHRAVTSQILNFFQPQELMEMTIGNEHYDWDVFQKFIYNEGYFENAEYKGDLWSGHPTIIAFWKVFREWDESQKRKFLLFLTGSDRVPLLGMKMIKIYIQGQSNERYPVAHTCFNLLDLPKIEDKEELSKRLLQAIEHTHGFTLV